jgi:hypothetical protein
MGSLRAPRRFFVGQVVITQRQKSLHRLVGYALPCPHGRAAERHAVRLSRRLGKLKHAPPLMRRGATTLGVVFRVPSGSGRLAIGHSRGAQPTRVRVTYPCCLPVRSVRRRRIDGSHRSIWKRTVLRYGAGMRATTYMPLRKSKSQPRFACVTWSRNRRPYPRS